MGARASIAIGSVASACVIVALTTAVAVAGASGLAERPGTPVTGSAVTVPGTAPATAAAPQTPLPTPQTVVAPQPEELPVPEGAAAPAAAVPDTPTSPDPGPQEESRGAPGVTVPGVARTPPARGEDSGELKKRGPGAHAWRTYGSGVRDQWSWGIRDGAPSRHHSQR